MFSKYLSESLLDENLTVIFHLSVLNKYTQDMVWRIGNCLWTYLNPPPKLWFINCHFLSRRVTCIHSHVFVLFHPMFATIWSIYFLTFKFGNYLVSWKTRVISLFLRNMFRKRPLIEEDTCHGFLLPLCSAADCNLG